MAGSPPFYLRKVLFRMITSSLLNAISRPLVVSCNTNYEWTRFHLIILPSFPITNAFIYAKLLALQRCSDVLRTSEFKIRIKNKVIGS